MINGTIQILGLRPYTKNGEEKLKHDFHNRRWQTKTVAGLFANLTEFLEQIPEEDRYNLYYTASNCKESDKPRLFESQSIIPFDIDGIDVSRINEYVDAVCEVLKIDENETGIVCSGNGLQFIIGLEKPFTDVTYFKEMLPYYKMCCQNIDSKLKHLELPGNADTVVWSEARLLRLPGTRNIKKNKGEKFATLKNAFILPRPFDLRIVCGGVVVADKKQITVNELKKFGAIDTEEVEAECLFLKYCKEHQEKVSEPEWYAMLSIVARLDDAREKAHEYSEHHPNYTAAATDEKFDQSRENAGPRTCENINSMNPICQKCRHFGAITSPVQLRGKTFIKSAKSKFHNIKIDKNGLPAPGQPQYEDLRRYFEKKHTYVTTEANWVYVWKKTHWVLMLDSMIEAFAQDHFEDLTVNAKVSEFLKFIHRTNKVDSSFFGTVDGMMNFTNGILDLRTKKLMDHDSSFGFTSVLNYEYDPSAVSPIFDNFMQEITCNRTELANVLLEFAGYSFSYSDYRWHKCLIMTGEGSNGKSTFIDILRELAGIGAYSTLMLNDLNNDAKLFLMMNKLFNVAEETPRKGLLDSSVFKIITAGGSYQVKQLYKQPQMVLKNKTKLMMACNELPSNLDNSAGFFRRLIIVPFEQSFVEGVNADTEILSKLKKELPGILNRIIEGYDRLVANDGFSKSKQITEAIEDYKRSTDTVSEWFYDNIEVTDNPEDIVITNAVFLKYVNWCEKFKCKFKAKNSFSKEFSHLSGKKSGQTKFDGQNIRGFKGVKLIDSNAF